MLVKSNQNTKLFLFVFALFLFSNVLTFAFQFWVYPNLILIEAIIWLIFALISFWIVMKLGEFLKFIIKLKQNWFIVPFLIYTCLTIIWSISFEISLYRWLVLASTFVTGAYVGLRFNLKDIIKYLSIFGIWILTLSLVLVIFIPSLGVMNYHSIQGAWRGVFWHKNHLGFFASFINILFLINVIEKDSLKVSNKVFWGVLYFFSLFILYRSDSVGAYISTLFLHGVIFLALIWMRFRKKIRINHVIIVFVILAICFLLIFVNLELFFGIFNRNTSLTGRIPMWSHLFDTYFSKKPLFGYGFNAFWYMDSHRIDITQGSGYPDQIIIADNGFIDLLVNTGIVGFTLFLLFYFGLWWRSIKYANHAENIIGFFPVILMAYVLIANVSWSLLFENENFFMLIMISILFCISNENAVPIIPDKQNAGR